MAINQQVLRPGTYYVQNKSTTVAYELRVDYEVVTIPANTQVNFMVTQNLFLPTSLLDIAVTKVPDKSINIG